MSREVQVRFCESRAVRFRPATHLACAVNPGSRPNRSRRGWPSGCNPGVLPSTRTRPGSCSLSDGFDFLGFNIRRYGSKLLIKPSTAAIRRLRKRLATEMRALRGSNAGAVLARLNPIIRGWAAYYRAAVSSKIFSRLDTYMWRLTYKWAKHSHPNKSKRGWSPTTSASSTSSATTDGCSATGDHHRGDLRPDQVPLDNIVRHQTVNGGSPDDPALTEYWAARRRRIKPPLDRYSLRLLAKPGQPVPTLRGPPALRRAAARISPSMGTVADHHPKGDHQKGDHHGRDSPDGDQTPPGTRLLPTGATKRPRQEPTSINPHGPSGLLEPCAGKTRTHGS